MIFPRAMNNFEKAGLVIVKESQLSYELQYDDSPYTGGYRVNIPELKSTYYLKQIHHFSTDLNKHKQTRI